MLDINNLLKCQRFTPSGCEHIAIKKFEFVAKTEFLCDKKEILIKSFFFICNMQSDSVKNIKDYSKLLQQLSQRSFYDKLKFSNFIFI